jgi:ectoine hydroxylase-related dioxygenase (phytanoyl-CoA dioxygenase family)
LENNFTIRIHLDDTDKDNGALKVIPASHLAGIVNAENILMPGSKEVLMNVRRGGIMLMKPLILHASGRTTNNHQRRVIQLEFSNSQLPGEMGWSEYEPIPQSDKG